MTDLTCWNCLVVGMRRNPAVTIRKGTAFCEGCAREFAEQERTADDAYARKMDELGAQISGRNR